MTSSHMLFEDISWARSSAALQQSSDQGEQLTSAALLTTPKGTVKLKIKS